jgi:geranylgeranyl diphosphate synthase type I
VLATEDPQVRGALARFGDDFGQAFQAYDDLLGIWATTERTGKLEMNDLVKRKKTLPVVMAFEKASPRLRSELAALFASPAPLAGESVERIREILDELGTREQLESEIASHRTRALHALHGITAMATAGEPLALLEQLVASATGAEEPVGSGSR